MTRMYEMDRQDTNKRFAVSLGIVLVLHIQLLWLAGRIPSVQLRDIKVVSSVEFMDVAAQPFAPPAAPARRKQISRNDARQRSPIADVRAARPSAGSGPAPAAQSPERERAELSVRRSARPATIVEAVPAATRPSPGTAYQSSVARPVGPAQIIDRAASIEVVGTRRHTAPAPALIDEQLQSRLSPGRREQGRRAADDGFAEVREVPVRSSAGRTAAANTVAGDPALTDSRAARIPAGGEDVAGTREISFDGGTIVGSQWGAQPRRRAGSAGSFASIDIASKAGVVPKKVAAPGSYSEAAREPMEITGPLQKRRILAAPMPVYPAWAREKSIEGHVTLKFFVGPSGVVLPKVFVLQTSGYAGLDQVCIDSVRTWLFAPLASSEPQSEQWGNITIRFELE